MSNRRSKFNREVICAIIATIWLCSVAMASTETDQKFDRDYSYGASSRDGIGKFYMGREISRVMGHRGASWLERPEREREERTDLLIERLPIEEHFVVVDLGAGTGYFSLRIARRVTDGQVLSVDIQRQMLDIIAERKRESGLDNIETILANEDEPNLPIGAVDLVLMVDAYHEFSHPREVVDGIVRSLKTGGRVVLIEYRAEDPSVAIKPLHKMSEQQAIRELTSAGLRWVETLDFLPQQHFLVFEK